MNYLGLAIKKLHPEAEFSLSNDDYSTIKWDKLQGDAPTQAEINAAILEVKADETAAKTKAEADKKTAETKLAALGLTVNDLKALGL
jgi:hypothetical protein